MLHVVRKYRETSKATTTAVVVGVVDPLVGTVPLGKAAPADALHVQKLSCTGDGLGRKKKKSATCGTWDAQVNLSECRSGAEV